MADAHKNFAYSTIATAPSPATSGTSLVVQAADGAKFPTPPFNATVWPVSTQPTTANAEIVRVTAVSTDTFTITRTQESTSARTIVVGDQIAAGITVKTITDLENTSTANTFMSQSATQQDITLPASTNFLADAVVEIGASYVLEIPSTSSLEITGYLPQSNVPYASLAPTIFSGQVLSIANTGSAGGTIWYMTLGGMKMAWGNTSTVSLTAATSNPYGVTFPANFFTTIQSFTASVAGGTASGTQFIGISGNAAVTTTQAQFYAISTPQTAVTGSMSRVDWFAIGT